MNKPLTDYFKAVRTPQTMQNTTKRKLSLNKKPTTPHKLSKESPSQRESYIIDLVNDNEEICEAPDLVCEKELKNSFNDQVSTENEDNVHDEVSCSSNSTIIYTPQTPKKSQSPQSSHSKSPKSRDNFFSPVKKRNMKIRTPFKAKKNLCDVIDANKEENQLLLDACMDMDDKTVFLLTIINKYLTTNELRPLLLKNSHDLLTKCMNIMKPGMRLVCRLYWRKVGWYRLGQVKQIMVDKNNSINDSTVQYMVNNLSENDIIECTNCEGSKSAIQFEDYVALLKLDELKSICKDLKLKMSSKVDAIKCLRAYSRQKSNISNYFIGNKSDNASRLLKIFSAQTGPCFKLSYGLRQTLDELYILMYLGIKHNVIREKKLELTLLYDKIKRECYPDIDVPLDNASVVFNTRDDFERYIQACNIYEEFLNSSEVPDKCRIVENVYSLYKNIDKNMMLRYRAIPPWLQRFTPPYLYIKVLEAGLLELKKIKTENNITLALDILTELTSQRTFRQYKKAEWYAEIALILDKFMSRADEAAKVLLKAFNLDLSEISKDFLRPRALLLATRQTNAVSSELQQDLLRHATKEQIMEKNLNAKHIYKLPMDLNKKRGKIKFETRTKDGFLVQDAEDFCIDHYIAEGKYTHGMHSEGKIVTTIFFLLFWDIIYARLAGVRGVYLTHYQMYPLDMFLESFYVNRKALIDERLKEIEESPIELVLERMYLTWNSRPETELSGIVRSIGWENVCSVSSCLQPRPLAVLCRRLATDYGYSHSGFPDLTLWNIHTKEVKFVEVKTDSDKPSIKQIQWMRYLQDNGIQTEFCYIGVNTKRCKARNNS